MIFARPANLSTRPRRKFDRQRNPRETWPAWTDQVIKLGADGEPIGPTSTQPRSGRKGGRS